jgi:hypothetical protein
VTEFENQKDEDGYLRDNNGIALDREALDLGIRLGIEARQRVLEDLDTGEIIEILAAAGRAWCEPHFLPRRETIEVLCDELRMHPNMLGQGFDSIFGAFNESEIKRWVAAEVDQPQALDGGVEHNGKPMRLLGPKVMFHALGGNIPGLAIPQIAAAVLARSVCILRESRRQPALTRAFIATLAEYSEDLAALLVPAGWLPNDTLMEKFAFDWAERVEITGSDQTIRGIAERHRHHRIVGHGSRLSLAVLPATTTPELWAQSLADEIVLYEGLGCLSPQLILVEGPAVASERLAHLLGIELDRLKILWPREGRGVRLESLRRQFISDAELAESFDPACGLLRGQDDCWAIRLDPQARLIPGPGMRCITIVPVPNLDMAAELLFDSELPLAGVSIAAEPGAEPFTTIAADATEAGATWVCKVGNIQKPPLSWQQDGVRRLADLLTWQALPAPSNQSRR